MSMPSRQKFHSPPEAAYALVLAHRDKNDPKDPNGRYAQFHAAETEAWAQCERAGKDTQQGAFWVTVAKLIAEQYHARLGEIDGRWHRDHWANDPKPDGESEQTDDEADEFEEVG